MAKGSQAIGAAGHAWTAVATARNTGITFANFAEVDYNSADFDRLHMNESQLRASLQVQNLRLREQERQEVVEREISAHREHFPHTLANPSWRTDRARELSAVYGSAPVTRKLVDQDIIKLQQIEVLMEERNIPAEDRQAYRRIIAQNIDRVDNPNGLLLSLEGHIREKFPELR